MTLRRRRRGSMLGRMPMDDDAGVAAGLPGRGYGGVLWEPSPEVVKRARAFEMRILAYEPAPDQAFVRAHGVELTSLEDLLRRADLVTLHCPATPESHHLINRGAADALVLEVGDRPEGDEADYPDIDMKLRLIDGKPAFLHKDGKPY